MAKTTYVEHIDSLARDEAHRILTQKLDTDDYFLLDKYSAAKKLSMKPGYFYKYIYGQPEEVAIRRYPVDPKTGLTSNKPFYLPSDLQHAVKAIANHWAARR